MASAKPIRHDVSEQRQTTASSRESDARLTPLRELQLLEKIRKGGPPGHDALCELIRGYQKRIYSICARMVRHHDDAADLTQETLIKVIEGLPSYNGQAKLSTWVIRVAMNCCLSHLRREKLRAHESLNTAAADADGGGWSDHAAAGGAKRGHSAPSESREPSPLQRIQQQQSREVILSALASIDPDMRAILVLRDLQDLDYQQLAEVLEIPIGTVKSRLFRARAALRHEIETRGGM